MKCSLKGCNNEAEWQSTGIMKDFYPFLCDECLTAVSVDIPKTRYHKRIEVENVEKVKMEAK